MIGSGMEAENNDLAQGGQGILDVLLNAALRGPNRGNQYGGGGASIPMGGPEANPTMGGAVPGVPGTPIPPFAGGAGGGAAAAAAGLPWLDILRVGGPLAASMLGRAFGGGGDLQNAQGSAELNELLRLAMERMRAQQPLSEALNRQALAGLPSYAQGK